VRALLLVLDSAGIGGAPDAAQYGDEGANTLGHILERVPELRLPNLDSLGLSELLPAHRLHTSHTTYKSSYGRMTERSAGKDTTTGTGKLPASILAEPFATFDRFPGGARDRARCGVNHRQLPHRSGTILSEQG
jgi:phosphopentomutase